MKLIKGRNPVQFDIQMEECILDKLIGKSLFHMATVRLLSLTIAHMKENGEMEKCMEKANFNGQMDQVMMVIIFTIRNMDKGDLFFLLEIIMKDIGRMVNNMAREFSSIKNQKKYKRVYGKMDNSLVIYEICDR